MKLLKVLVLVAAVPALMLARGGGGGGGGHAGGGGGGHAGGGSFGGGGARVVDWPGWRGPRRRRLRRCARRRIWRGVWLPWRGSVSLRLWLRRLWLRRLRLRSWPGVGLGLSILRLRLPVLRSLLFRRLLRRSLRVQFGVLSARALFLCSGTAGSELSNCSQLPSRSSCNRSTQRSGSASQHVERRSRLLLIAFTDHSIRAAIEYHVDGGTLHWTTRGRRADAGSARDGRPQLQPAD